MPRSNKRTQKARRESPEASDVGSSPTPPSKRRKQTNDSQSLRKHNTNSTSAKDQQLELSQGWMQEHHHEHHLEDYDPAMGGSGLDGDEATRIAPFLAAPENFIQASKDHSNEIHNGSTDAVSAYAKIAARNWTYFVTTLVINIGRCSDPAPSSGDEDKAVHIDLGPHKLVSRLHARVSFDHSDTRWLLEVKGRNGVKVNGTPLKMSATHLLSSGEVIEIAGVEMMFVMPSQVSPLRIHSMYLERCGLSKVHEMDENDGEEDEGEEDELEEDEEDEGGEDDIDDDDDAEEANMSARTDDRVNRAAHATQAPGKQRTPAPDADIDAVSGGNPNGLGRARDGTSQRQKRSRCTVSRRLGTPPSQIENGDTGRFNQSPTQERDRAGEGTPAGNPASIRSGGIDLSHDDSQHVKPQFSYAQLITQAIMHAQDGKLNLNGIYNFIMENYSYYRHQQLAGWQNSIRHNLSLNKAFDKVARSTDEPGKGMKWQIVSESKEDLMRTAYKLGRGGHRGSSAPSSPGNLNYVSHSPRELAARGSTSARKRKTSPTESPTPRVASRVQQHGPPDSRVFARAHADTDPLARAQTTPDRRLRTIVEHPSTRQQDNDTPSAPSQRLSTVATTSGFSNLPQSPTLAPSFFPEDPTSFVTPAPPRAQLKLAPPSTMQRSSQHMPTSSPAPFWKYADIGSTPPLKPPTHFETSPSRPGTGNIFPQSSSPPRGSRSPMLSPPTAPEHPATRATGDEPDDTEELGFDLTKGFQSIGSYHNPAGRTSSTFLPASAVRRRE